MVSESVVSMIYSLQGYSYFFLFLMMVFQGPIITALAAFASSIGFFNIYVIFSISVLGNLIPDIILYFIGKSCRSDFIMKILFKFGISKKKISFLERGLKKHAEKTLVITKLTPALPVPGLILAGFVGIPFLRFLYIVVVFNLVASTIFTFLGYYFGVIFVNLFNYFKFSQYVIFALVILMIIFYLVYKKIYPLIISRLK